jgi:PAS domain-containing protein
MPEENKSKDEQKKSRSYDVNSGPIQDIAGDVTSRKKTEKVLIESEGRYRTLVEASSDAILLIDKNRNIISCNPAFLNMFGYTSGELEGESIKSIHLSDEKYQAFGKLVYLVIVKKGKARLEWDYQ